jgi:hypothetical protein
MGFLIIEGILAAFALKRGWRIAPFALVALPLATYFFEEAFAAALGPWIGTYFDPANTARALGHGVALVGLAITCWTDPSEAPTAAKQDKRAPQRPARRRSRALYEI